MSDPGGECLRNVAARVTVRTYQHMRAGPAPVFQGGNALTFERAGRSRGTALAHDGLFREVFGVPADAASLLRTVLPPELAERLDLDGVTECPGDFTSWPTSRLKRSKR